MSKTLLMEIHQRWLNKRSTFALGLSKGGKWQVTSDNLNVAIVPEVELRTLLGSIVNH